MKCMKREEIQNCFLGQDLVKSTDYSPRIQSSNKRNLVCVHEGFFKFLAFASPESSDFLGLTGPFQPRATISCKKPNFGGFLINLSCQMLGDKMVKIGEGGAAVEG